MSYRVDEGSYGVAQSLLGGRTALLIIDAQNDYLHADGAASVRRNVDLSVCRAAVPQLNELVRAARAADVPVIYVRNVHAPEDTLPNKLARRGGSVADLWPTDGTWGADWYEELERPAKGDIVLTKYNYDSFNDTALSLHLRALDVVTLVVTGFATEVCVESTCRRAFVEGYEVLVPPETTAGFSAEAVHASLSVLDRFFAHVVPIDAVTGVWAREEVASHRPAGTGQESP